MKIYELSSCPLMDAYLLLSMTDRALRILNRRKDLLNFFLFQIVN